MYRVPARKNFLGTDGYRVTARKIFFVHRWVLGTGQIFNDADPWFWEWSDRNDQQNFGVKLFSSNYELPPYINTTKLCYFLCLKFRMSRTRSIARKCPEQLLYDRCRNFGNKWAWLSKLLYQIFRNTVLILLLIYYYFDQKHGQRRHRRIFS